MEQYLCEIRLFAGNFAPKGWAFCNGQLLPLSQYQAVFSILGTTYGGDGRTTFALPDLRGRVPIHAGSSRGPGVQEVRLGESGGSNTNTLLVSNLPAHNHSVNASDKLGTTGNPSTNFPANSGGNDKEYSDSANSTMNHQMTGQTGNNVPITNMQPYLGLNYIISLQGIFPNQS